jgi:signal transduction histidine kinase
MEGQGFERFIEELSTSFVRASVAEIGPLIDHWIKEIVLGHNLDRGALAQIDTKSGKLTVRNSWSRGNLVKLRVGMQLANRAPWFDRTLMTGRTLVFSSISELMPEFTSDYKTFRRYFPKSNVTVPLRVGGETIGAVGFATLHKERSWPPRLIRRLQLVGEVFGNALERRRAVEENALLRSELTHVARAAAMGELTASITHQLYQPIGAILGNAEAIQSTLDSDQPDLGEVREGITDIVQDTLRVTEIFKGLRAFFRKDQIEVAPLDLRSLIGEVVRLVRSDALFRNISLRFDAPTVLPRAMGDRIQLQQAILNLILNAFDAVSGDREVREVSVDVSREGNRIKLAVCDSGDGIEPNLLTKIFEPFYTTKPGGLGVGLSIAASIVKAHRGEVSAHSIVGNGASFEISLPAMQEKAARLDQANART